MLCLIGVWMTAGATVPPRIPRAGGMTAAHTYRAPWFEPQRRAANQIDAPLRSIGVQKIPVVLVEFADLRKLWFCARLFCAAERQPVFAGV